MGYLFNPTYHVTSKTGTTVLQLKKSPSFFGKEFELVKTTSIDQDDKERVMLSRMMMILLERRSG